MAQDGAASSRPEIFVVSDGTGETAMASVRAAMSQFQTRWRLRTFGETRTASQVERIIQLAQEAGALVVFTLVDQVLARDARDLAAQRGVPVVDLLGPLIFAVADHSGLSPHFRAGVLHGFNAEALQRVEAVEFAVRHDDGANLRTLFQADLVLTGVSRTSKTPLAMYLAHRGYKTGNVPVVPGMPLPKEVLDLDPRKVFGLVVSPATLLEVRRSRIRSLGASPYLDYADPETVEAELQRARRLFRERGFRIVDITNRAVEENAARILQLYEAWT
ncbi:MAG TPA: pyruvate, water dikinase regulatory protein, partial [Myxococcota bacterium]|nr:pyruvate, water dikinase regulatory protein [Myxococcota bacterium]